MNWIKEHIKLSDEISIDEIVDKLTKASVEVDGVQIIGDWWDTTLIQVGLVKDIKPHPNADRLRLADIQLSSSDIQRVVCGAPNLAVGQKIIFAKTGSKVFSPKDNEYMKLEQATIRGVESNGMVLSESELGISDNHEGILVLDNESEIGVSAKDLLSDVILDVHIWPNRPDLMNIIGIAREIDSIFNNESTLKLPEMNYEIKEDKKIIFPQIKVDDYAQCSRYMGLLIKDVTIGESPTWLKDKLRSVGMRPIYNVVDITNYVMMELGQPLHAFDFDKLNGSIQVRNAKDNEVLTTLDGELRELNSEDLVIADDSAVIALAGVMGGANSDINNDTNSVFLEAANFNPNSIRRTSQKYDLRSEASARFERNLPPYLAEIAIKRAAKLIEDICGGHACHAFVDINDKLDLNPQLIEMDINIVRRICGIDVSVDEVVEKLKLLGFKLQSHNKDILQIEIPLWRTDVHIIDDLIEEFIRIYGYDTVPSVPLSGAIPMHDKQNVVTLRDNLKDLFVNKGFYEVINYSLTKKEKIIDVLGEEAVTVTVPIELKNTLSSERSVLRTTMRHSILETIDYNLKNGQENIWIFEAGRTYAYKNKNQQGIYEKSPLAEDEYIVGGVCAKDTDRFGFSTDMPINFFEVKGILESIFLKMKLIDRYIEADIFGFTQEAAEIQINNESIGLLGMIDSATLKKFDIAEEVILFEINLTTLQSLIQESNHFVPFSKFPAVINDIALVVDQNISHEQVLEELTDSLLIVNAQLFDIYTGDQIDSNKKSLAFKLTFQSHDKTLTNDEVKVEQDKIVDRVSKKFDATIRQ
ncbi:MAG: phenylalanine--tRNA ligase subunit beta [Dehalococcoidia bacterium]|nr:phenylalanine--tRNA ligase subunit beta [Dehalococcoidia bacterium]